MKKEDLKKTDSWEYLYKIKDYDGVYSFEGTDEEESYEGVYTVYFFRKYDLNYNTSDSDVIGIHNLSNVNFA